MSDSMGAGTALPVVIACPDCAAVQRLPEIRSGRLACRRCDATLERATGRSLNAALACALATLILLFPANLLLLFRISTDGISAQSHLASGVLVMWQQGWVLTAIAVAVQAVMLPFIRFGLLAAALGAIRLGREERWIGPAFRWAEKLDLWAMPDVFLIGCAIGYSRLAPFVPVTIGPGGWCFLGAALMCMLTRASLDRRAVWRRIRAPAPPSGDTLGCAACDLVLPIASEGERCPRCGQRAWLRKPAAMVYATALTVAGCLFYPVANLYPLSILLWPGGEAQRTLFSAVGLLIGANLWLLACLIFITSIAIPLAKLLAMAWFLLSVRRRSTRHLGFKTRLYRAVDELGRWSNMDIYTIAVYVPLLQFGHFANGRIGIGTPALLAVVVLTMLASSLFDPRLMWDAPGATP